MSPKDPLTYKDTVSPCETYSNPYDHREHPDFEAARKRNLEKRMQAAQDKVETEQQRLERRLIEQFQNSQFTLPGEKLYIFGQLGKFFFLAFTLPPYIFFYGMPKWLIENAMMPAVKSMIRGGNKAKQGVETVVQILVQRLQQVQKAFKRSYQVVMNVVMVPQNLIMKFSKKLIAQWNALKIAMKEAGKVAPKELSGPETVQEKEKGTNSKFISMAVLIVQIPFKIKSIFIDKPIQFVQTAIRKTVETVKERWSKFKEVVDIREPIKAFVQTQLQALHTRVQPIYQVPIKIAVKTYQKTVEISKYVVQSVVEPIQKRYETVKEKTKELVQSVQQVSQKIQERLQTFIAAYPVHYWNKSKERVQSVREAAGNIVEKIQEKIRVIKNSIVESINFTKEVVRHSINWTTQVVVPWVVVQLTIPLQVAQYMVFGGINVVKFIAQKIRYKTVQVINRVKSMMNMAWNGAKKTFVYLKEKSHALFLKYVYPVVSKLTITNFILLLRWIFTWIKILLKLGWIILTDLFNDALTIRKRID